MRLTWFGHSSIKLETAKQVIYIDPYAGPDDWYTPGSIVLISRWHYDHCSVAKVRKASNDATHVIGTPEVAAELFPCQVLSPGKSRFFDGVEVVAMPVENPHIDERNHDHPPISSLGFVILAENKKVYFMGDSTFMPQLEKMMPDVLLIAVGGTYTPGARAAAKAADLISAKLAIPVHWGSVVGTRDDAELFKELSTVPVSVLEPGQSVEI